MITVRQGPPSRRNGDPRLLLFIVAIICLLPLIVGFTPSAGATEAEDAVGSGLARINEARAAIGVPPLKRNAALDVAATAHANYYKLNFGDPALAGNGLHYEEPGKAGFTGADFAARARAAGYSGSINENVGVSGSMLVSVEWFLDVINHRLTLIDPRYTDVGFGVVNEGKIKIEVIDLGTEGGSTRSSRPGCPGRRPTPAGSACASTARAAVRSPIRNCPPATRSP